MFTTLAILSLAASAVSAGPHGRYASHHSHTRRHHAKHVHDPKAESLFKLVYNSRRADCEDGAWNCDGSALQHCDHGSWLNVQDCTGDNIVCSADSRATGCIWSWSLDQASPVRASSSATTANTDTATSAKSTATSAAENHDDVGDDCEENDTFKDDGDSTDEANSSSSSTASFIGDVLVANPSSTKKHKTTKTRDWYHQNTVFAAEKWPTWSASSTSTTSYSEVTSSAGDWNDEWPTLATRTTTEWYGQTSATTGTSTKEGKGRKTSTTRPSASATGRVTDTTSGTATGKSSASATATGSTGGTTNNSGSFSAPHYVVYSDENLSSMPSASDLSSYNRFILAFWMAGSGAVDNAQVWEQLDGSTRLSTIQEYHNAGIALMVSAFGSTDTPTTSGVDPTSCAQQLAGWVKQYGLDGVDIDYEDMDAMNSGTAEAWLITFQTELRSLLPSYLISHAPIAPWFASDGSYTNGAYVKVHEQVGNGIDWYNVQFYNQGTNAYTSCETLITDSGNSWPDTSVMGIHSNTGMALDKIVIGKPLDSGAAADGYMDGSTLNTCVTLAKSQGWNAGVMFWEWKTSIAGTLMAEVLG